MTDNNQQPHRKLTREEKRLAHQKELQDVDEKDGKEIFWITVGILSVFILFSVWLLFVDENDDDSKYYLQEALAVLCGQIFILFVVAREKTKLMFLCFLSLFKSKPMTYRDKSWAILFVSQILATLCFVLGLDIWFLTNYATRIGAAIAINLINIVTVLWQQWRYKK